MRALRGDDVVQKAIADAHSTAIAEAMEYLAAHAGYTRVHNPLTGDKDLVRLPGLVGIGYQHETSRCGDPHLHTHVIVPNRQARADGVLVSLDGTSVFHEARAAGVIYQAKLWVKDEDTAGLSADQDRAVPVFSLERFSAPLWVCRRVCRGMTISGITFQVVGCRAPSRTGTARRVTG